MSESSEPAQDVFQLVGTVLDGKFRIERVVARGGFGIVYEGHHLGLEVPVAVKVLRERDTDGAPPGGHEVFFDRFRLEARTVARIKHPSIVHVLDTGVSAMPSGERAPWMVLEWLTGATLEAELETPARAPRSPGAALALLRPVFEALAFAHEEGIAHRDVKPANIMRASSRRGAALKVLDFGLAKVMDGAESAGSGLTATRSGVRAFSLLFAAPEQVTGTRTGPWTDVHALGLLFTEVVLGAHAYRNTETSRLYQEILSPERPTPARRGVALGPLDAVLERALAFAPEDRYANARAMLEALEAAVAATPEADRVPAVPAEVSARSSGRVVWRAAPAEGDAPGFSRALTRPQTTLADGRARTTLAAAVSEAPDTKARARARRTGRKLWLGALLVVLAALPIVGAVRGRAAVGARGAAGAPGGTTAASAGGGAHATSPDPATARAAATASTASTATTDARGARSVITSGGESPDAGAAPGVAHASGAEAGPGPSSSPTSTASSSPTSTASTASTAPSSREAHAPRPAGGPRTGAASDARAVRVRPGRSGRAYNLE